MRELAIQLVIRTIALVLAAFLPVGWAAVVMWASGRWRGRSAAWIDVDHSKLH